MTFAEKAERKVVEAVLSKLLKYIDKEPQKNILKLVTLAEKLLKGTFPQHYLDAIKEAAKNADGVYYQMAMNILKDINRDTLKKLILAMGLGAGVHGTKAVRENREKYKCNIPFQVLIDPTSACNRNCKGCWAAEYGYKNNLSYEEMADVVRQCKELGTHN